MGLNPAATADQLRAKLTVDFLRGGMTTNGSRDEVLNQPSVAPPAPAVGPTAGEQQKYSYFYQDDAPPPGAPPQFQTDGESDPKGYAHKLGDIFHSEPLMIEPPRYFQYLSANLNNYATFADLHEVPAQGAVRRRQRRIPARASTRASGTATTAAPSTTRGTSAPGREIFAYAPAPIMAGNFPALLNLPPRPQYFVDGSMGQGATSSSTRSTTARPTAAQRIWRSVVVGGLRQGGNYVWALDVTQPDKIDAQGIKTAAKDNAPDCLDGGGGVAAARRASSSPATTRRSSGR